MATSHKSFHAVSCAACDGGRGPAMAEQVAVSAALELVAFTLIVDDIVLPSGETVMEALGGGGEHSP
jgi:hypothetical protein